MLKLRFSKKFKKELKQIEKRGLKMKKLNKVIEMLVDEKQLTTRILKPMPHTLR